jgi:type II secretory pathway component PulC
MQHNKIISAAARLACLTIAAYVLAQGAAMIMSRNFDASSEINAVTAAQNQSESAVPLLPRLNAPGLNESAKVAAGDSDRGVKVEQVSDTRWILDRTSMLASTRDLNRFLKQARAVPCIKQGRTVGYRITRISPGSFCEKIGLQNGDVLLKANTQRLDNPQRLFGLYQEMRNVRHVSILLSRNGQDQTFDYDIR